MPADYGEGRTRDCLGSDSIIGRGTVSTRIIPILIPAWKGHLTNLKSKENQLELDCRANIQLDSVSMSRCVIITGMQRSGTSAVARMLNLCGLDLGPEEDWRPAAPDNPEGFWENKTVIAFNDAILSRAGGRWDRLPIGGVNPDVATADCVRQLQTPAIWGMKDPRFYLTLPAWREHIRSHVIICVRSPIEVALSMADQPETQTPVAEGLRLWLAYNESILVETEDVDRSVIHYETLLMDSQSPLQRLLFWLDLKPSDDRIAAAAGFPKRAPDRRRAGIAELQAVASSRSAGTVCAYVFDGSYIRAIAAVRMGIA